MAPLIRQPDQIIHSLKPIRTATNNDLTYFDPNQNNITTQDLKQTQAGVVITTAQFQSLCPHATIVVDQPRQAFAIIAHLFEHTP